MARVFLCITCGVALSALTGCRLYSPPYGYDGAYAYPSAPQGAYAMPPQMSASPFMGAPVYSSSPGPGPYYSYPSPTAPTYTTTNPEVTTTNPDFTVTNPEVTTTNPAVPPSKRPVDKLVPDSEALETPSINAAPSETIDNAPPSTTTKPSTVDPADFGDDRANPPAEAPPAKTPADRLKKIEQKPFQDSESKLDPKVKPSSGEAETEEFEAPSAFNPGKAEAPTGDAADMDSDQKASPYAYDQKTWTWLRGTAHFDDAEQSWSLRYAPEDSKDKYHGSMALTDHSLLSTIKEGDVIFVKGEIDPATKASLTPKFKIKTLKRLVAEE
ncbi:MAG: hypothetical protein U0903_15790 [Planctomycetales bacterium]